MKVRVYTDTSVLGGCEDEEFAEHSVRLLEGFIRGEFVVNLQRIHGYNSVNLRRGYPMIEIRTPREVLSDE
ncbi:MAG: hypothetical protein ABJC13_10275 [Acidobacteriota bacterium]